MSVDLNNRIAVVTGATRGIGRDIALGLAARGATVVGTGTTQAGADSISAAFSAAGYQGVGMALDVTGADQVVDFAKRVADEVGVPQILVNNAGITRDDLLMRMKEDAWNATIDTNLTAVYRTSKAFLRGMTKARTGRIINITSVVATMGNAGQTNYAAAKAGMIGFTKSLALEVAARNITVNAIAPGFIETDMTSALSEDVRESLTKQIPLQRLGAPADIASAAAFLASDEAAYITGTTMHVNGGMYLA